MWGAIAGDVIGSVYEWCGTITKEFPLFTGHTTFTDDSVLSVAVAHWILTGDDLAYTLREYARTYRGRGYGGMFARWIDSPERGPYGSYGNGSAMRVSAVSHAFDTVDEVLVWAERSAAVTHDHPEGIRGAQGAALAGFLARTGRGKEEIRREVTSRLGYDLNRTVDDIRPTYHFDETCQGTVPQAIVAFLDSTDWEDAVRNAISLGGDADTLACITGGIAEAYYGEVPAAILDEVRTRVDPRMVEVIERFSSKHPIRPGTIAREP